MANTIHVDVVSAEESIYSGEAEFVVLPGVMGELGVYPKHTPLITQIKPGEVRIKVPGQAEEPMQNKASKEDVARAEGELAGALAQLAAIRKLRKGRG